MSDVGGAIVDAAERRMRIGGFNGFSFREIAADVGVKSSSVHYHFPTKEKLAAAVLHRYTDETASFIDELSKTEADPVKVWTRAFRGTANSDKRMCPATVLAAASLDLPPEVAAEVKRFFKMCLDKMAKSGLKPDKASELLARITGALVIANAFREKPFFDHATAGIGKESPASAARTARKRPH